MNSNSKKSNCIISIVLNSVIALIAFIYIIVNVVKYYDAWGYWEVWVAVAFFIGGLVSITSNIIMLSNITKTEAKKQTTEPSNDNEILRYKKLFDEGVITQEEFEAKKKQLLNL